MPSDAIAVLKADHRALRSLFDDFDELGPRAVKSAGHLRDRIVKELSIHTAIEERVLYPVTIELVPDLEADVLEGMQEHALAEQVLALVAAADPTDRWFRPRVKVLSEMVLHHIREEERNLFPALRAALSRQQLLDLGEALRDERASAPTTPPAGAKVRALLEDASDRTHAFLNSLAAPARAAS